MTKNECKFYYRYNYFISLIFYTAEPFQSHFNRFSNQFYDESVYKENMVKQSTWANDYLRITTTCLQRPPFWCPSFTFYKIKHPLNNDQSTTATNLGFREWSVYTGLTVLRYPNIVIQFRDFVTKKFFIKISGFKSVGISPTTCIYSQ